MHSSRACHNRLPPDHSLWAGNRVPLPLQIGEHVHVGGCPSVYPFSSFFLVLAGAVLVGQPKGGLGLREHSAARRGWIEILRRGRQCPAISSPAAQGRERQRQSRWQSLCCRPSLPPCGDFAARGRAGDQIAARAWRVASDTARSLRRPNGPPVAIGLAPWRFGAIARRKVPGGARVIWPQGATRRAPWGAAINSRRFSWRANRNHPRPSSTWGRPSCGSAQGCSGKAHKRPGCA